MCSLKTCLTLPVSYPADISLAQDAMAPGLIANLQGSAAGLCHSPCFVTLNKHTLLLPDSSRDNLPSSWLAMQALYPQKGWLEYSRGLAPAELRKMLSRMTAWTDGSAPWDASLSYALAGSGKPAPLRDLMQVQSVWLWCTQSGHDSAQTVARAVLKGPAAW